MTYRLGILLSDTNTLDALTVNLFSLNALFIKNIFIV